jgi:hypothetical protein
MKNICATGVPATGKYTTTNNQRLQSETIDWLRFPLVIFVVFIHSFGLPRTANLAEINYSALSGMDIYNIIRVVIREIAAICNSGFFLFSGYLFFSNVDRFNQETYLKKIKTRVKTLLIPYVLWNLIAILSQLAMIWGGGIIKQEGDYGSFTLFFNDILDKGIGNIFWHFSTWNGSNLLGWTMPGIAPFSVPLWFLQTLIILTVVSPAIYLFCKYLKKYGIILLALLYYTRIWFPIPGLEIGPIFFFTLGAFYSIYRKNLILEMRRYKRFWYVMAVITLLPAAYYDYDGVSAFNYFSPLFAVAAVISFINIASGLMEAKKIKVNKTLSQATFFVYVSHTVLILSIVGFAFDKIFGSDSPIILIIRYFSVPIITAYASVVLYCILKRIMPKLLNILSGNR